MEDELDPRSQTTVWDDSADATNSTIDKLVFYCIIHISVSPQSDLWKENSALQANDGQKGLGNNREEEIIG